LSKTQAASLHQEDRQIRQEERSTASTDRRTGHKVRATNAEPAGEFGQQADRQASGCI